MRLLKSVSLAAATVVIAFALVPAAKADPITITGTAGGFSLSSLGNDGSGASGMDALEGAKHDFMGEVDGAGSFLALLNPLTFTTDYTGASSGGSHPFSFTQLLTINGQTQTLNIIGSIDIAHLADTIHLSAAPLTFTFDTFSVIVDVIPTNLDGPKGMTYGELKAKIKVIPNTAVPEPATLTLLGLGLAGAAAKIRQRRRRKSS